MPQAVVIVLWVLTMTAGLCWARWAVVLLMAMTAMACLIQQPPLLSQSGGWFQLIVFVGTPWLVAGQRATYGQQVRQTQADEAARMKRFQEVMRELLGLQTRIRQTESRIAKITDLYHVTKETTRALRVGELFTTSLEIIPRLLDVRGLRLIDVVGSGQSPLVLRAQRQPDGRLAAADGNRLLPVEETILTQTVQSGQASSGTVSELSSGERPVDVARMAWAPLWGEQRPIGVLIADELPMEQLGTLSIVANQLSLQLARIHLYQTIESLAVTDTLTGLFVRRYFLEFAAEELERSTHQKLPCTFLLADLDLFKVKNDTYGHLVGDVILREVAQLLQSNLRAVDLIARYGGEEFIFLLVETDPEQAMAVAQRLRQAVETHSIRAYDETLTQTISIGLACFPHDGQALPQLIERTDQALYAAKRAGRNRVVRWSNQLPSAPAVEASSSGSVT